MESDADLPLSALFLTRACFKHAFFFVDETDRTLRAILFGLSGTWANCCLRGMFQFALAPQILFSEARRWSVSMVIDCTGLFSRGDARNVSLGTRAALHVRPRAELGNTC